ncbi:LOW QUALITY PROTEIN: Trace amine-associated receptor 6 [Plecturocebus cupreus]
MHSGAVFYTGVYDDGLEEFSSALNCIGDHCKLKLGVDRFSILFLPTLVMIILYGNIFLVARQQAKKIENTGSKTELSSESYKARVASRERKAAKTLGVTVVAFMISWLPYSIDSLIDAFMGFITPAYIYEIFCWCAYYNSATNPLIYALFYPWFRKAIKVIVTGQVLKNSSATMNLFSEHGPCAGLLHSSWVHVQDGQVSYIDSWAQVYFCVAGAIGMCHHAWLMFFKKIIFGEKGSRFIAQLGLKHLTSSNAPILVSLSAEITYMNHYARP